MEFFNKEEAYIIIENQTDIFTKEKLKIKAIPAWQWISK